MVFYVYIFENVNIAIAKRLPFRELIVYNIHPGCKYIYYEEHVFYCLSDIDFFVMLKLQTGCLTIFMYTTFGMVLR
jgi:hypothetical protein